MSETSRKIYEANLTQIHGLVRGIAGRIVARFGKTDEFEELEALGRFLAFEAIPNFDPTRGVKLTTYLYPYLLGGMFRHMYKNGRYVCDERLLQLHSSTEDYQAGGILEANPYQMTPEKVFEIHEMTQFYQDMCKDFPADFERLNLRAMSLKSSAKRAKHYRARRKSLKRVKGSVERYYA